ncbi:hypothetical protein M1D96_05225 [Pseudomonas sp. D1-3]
MQAQVLAALPMLVEARSLPLHGAGNIDPVQQMAAGQLAPLAAEHAGDRRVGEADTPLLVDHQNAFGGVDENRGVCLPASVA